MMMTTFRGFPLFDIQGYSSKVLGSASAPHLPGPTPFAGQSAETSWLAARAARRKKCLFVVGLMLDEAKSVPSLFSSLSDQLTVPPETKKMPESGLSTEIQSKGSRESNPERSEPFNTFKIM